MLVAAAVGLFLLGLASLAALAAVLGGSDGTITAQFLGLSLVDAPTAAVGAIAAALTSVGVVAIAWGAVLVMRARERAQYRARMDTAAYNARLEVRNRLLEQQATALESRLDDLNKRVREIEDRGVVTIPEPAPTMPMRNKMHFPRVPEHTTIEEVRKPKPAPPADVETPASPPPRREKQPFPRLPDDVVQLPDADDPARKRRSATRRRRAQP